MKTLVVVLLVALPGLGADDAVFEVRGLGAEGREAYSGGGKVEFLSAETTDQLVHLPAEGAIPLRMRIGYRVLESAPVLLNSRLGTEYWLLYQYGPETMSALHTRENVDLGRPGDAVAEVAEAAPDVQRGVALAKGLVGVRGHSYFLIDQANGEWLDVAEPPRFFDRPDLARKLVFTLANLERFEVSVEAVESTWEPGGPIRVRLAVTDADGDVLPVVNAPAFLSAGDWRCELATQEGPVQCPTGWLEGVLPVVVPGEVEVHATVSAMTPRGPETVGVRATVPRGTGRRTAEEMAPPIAAWQPERAPDGTVRETRALWLHDKDTADAGAIGALVAQAAEAGLNVLIPCIFLRNDLVARTDVPPFSEPGEEDFDRLAYLIERAHSAGLEVHPWFCVTYRDAAFREAFPGVDMVNEDGSVRKYGADVHRPEYRDLVVDVMVGVARDYDVDGIHLDYIRSMGRCYCERCREEFAAAYGHPLGDATDEEWSDWQKQAVGDIVRRTSEGVRAVRPDAILSAAVFSVPAYGAEQGQAPATWHKDGWVDVVIPMDYEVQTLSVRSTERQFLAALGSPDGLVTGLCLYDVVNGSVVSRPAERVEEQSATVRSLGIPGYCLFARAYMDDAIVAMLRDRVNTEPARPHFR